MICSKCGVDKAETDFYKSNKNTCKECIKKSVYENRVKRLIKYAEENGISYNPRGHRIISNDPELKYCPSCKQFLKLNEFGHHRGKKSRLYINTYCKKCNSKKVMDSPNRDIVMLKSNINKKIKVNNDIQYKEKIKNSKINWNHSIKGIAYNMYKSAKKRAELYNIDFNITIDDIIIPDKCPILNHELKVGTVGGSKYSPSLDRINPNLGYVKGNIQVISRLANSMKNNASPEELKLFATYIINNY